MFGKKKIIEQRDRMIAYKKTFNSEHGKIVLIDLINRNYVINTHRNRPDKDHCEGQRDAVLQILHNLRITAEQLDEMLKTGNIEIQGENE